MAEVFVKQTRSCIKLRALIRLQEKLWEMLRTPRKLTENITRQETRTTKRRKRVQRVERTYTKHAKHIHNIKTEHVHRW